MTAKLNHIQPIQIIGTQRSGSNLLRLILSQSPEIAAPHPPHILETMLPLVDKYGSLHDDSNFYRLINDVCRLIEVNPIKWEVELDRSTIARSCHSRSLIEVFKVVYEYTAQSKKAKYWCCKSMANVQYFSLIEKQGIHPFYIHLIRDGRDVAASFRQILVGEKHPYHLASIWKANYLKACEMERSLGPERFMSIKYETLITNPHSIFKLLHERLNIDLADVALDFYHSEESKKTAQAGFMWKNVDNPLISANDKKYLHELSSTDIEIFERVARDILLENNYPLHSNQHAEGFSPAEIHVFDSENRRLKNEMTKMRHLQLDQELRNDRQNLLEELKF